MRSAIEQHAAVLSGAPGATLCGLYLTNMRKTKNHPGTCSADFHYEIPHSISSLS